MALALAVADACEVHPSPVIEPDEAVAEAWAVAPLPFVVTVVKAMPLDASALAVAARDVEAVGVGQGHAPREQVEGLRRQPLGS